MNSNNNYDLINCANSGNVSMETFNAMLYHPTIDVNRQDMYGHTALTRACWYGRDEMVDLLLKHPCIDVNFQNRNGDTALMFASCTIFLNIVQTLIKHGADPFLNDCKALKYAKDYDNKKVINYLENVIKLLKL
jgi:ankyrin repeat protein